MYIERINGPEDLKSLSVPELRILADETREILIEKLSKTGGHVGSNLGVVELTVALHYVFDSPRDRIVWDVSHQCYAHKILTGRKDAFTDPERYGEVTGFTNPAESEHDIFTVGHTSTSVSLAVGLALERDLSGGDGKVVAVIGDGSLSGGEAFEGLNIAGEYGKDLIVIVNDNDQSVAENHGSLYRKLRELRESGGKCPDNPFAALGFDYRYCEEGNDVGKLVGVLEEIRGASRPVVLHVHTVKGKGLPFAEADRENWHSAAPFDRTYGSPENGKPVYDTTVHDALVGLLERDPRSVVLTAGTPRALGFVGDERAELESRRRLIDVGIAEASAVTVAAAVAQSGGTAVAGIYAPFLQRAYDQISHDVCLNCSPAVILVLLPGAFGMKSNTHLGLCDVQMLSHIPNMVYLAPAYREEFLRMFRYAVTEKSHPVAIRVPARFYDGGEDDTDYSVRNRAKVVRRGSSAAIIAVGSLIPLALETADEYERRTGRGITVINPRFLTGTDDGLLTDLLADHSLVITIEDGEADSGYGSRIASFYGDKNMKVVNLGISKAFHSDFKAEELLSACGISVENMIGIISKNEKEERT